MSGPLSQIHGTSMLESIIRALANGYSKTEIEQQFAGRMTPGSLSATMSIARRRLKLSPAGPTGVPSSFIVAGGLSPDVSTAFDFEAKERGFTRDELATKLLTIIATEALFDAVLG